MYVLDSDTLIYFLKGHSTVVHHFISTNPEYLYTTAANQAELIFGAQNSQKKKKNLETLSELFKELKILDFNSDAAHLFGLEKARLKSTGTLIADMDLIIASICKAHNMTLITNNLKHFNRVKNLKCQTWVDIPVADDI